MTNTPFQKGDKVVAYCRYSEGDEQGLKNTSTDEQEQAIRQFCDRAGLVVVRVFADPFASGRSVQGRDHYLEMLSFLLHKKKPDIQGVVLWDFERYGRNYDQAQLDATRLRMAGYKIYSLQQPIVDNSPFAHVLEAMYFASAQNQSDMISADVKRALQHNFKTYKVIPRSCIPDGWIAVPVQMGYLSDGRERIGYRAEPDPSFITPIRNAVNARIGGATIARICMMLGKPFDHPEKVEKLMVKPLLYGSFSYGGTVIEDYCTPIIDKPTFDKLQTVHASLKRKIRREGSGAYSKDRAMLSGLCWCGVCGKRVYIERRKAGGKLYETYYCDDKHSNWRKTVLDDLVRKSVIELLTDRWQVTKDALLAPAPIEITSEINDLIMADIARIDKKIDAITDAIADMGNSRALMLKLKALEAQREDLCRKLRPESAPDPNGIDNALESLRESALSVLKDEKSKPDELRSALSLFVLSVTTYPQGQIIIRHTLPFFGGEMSGDPTAPPEGDGIHPQFLDTSFYLIPRLIP